MSTKCIRTRFGKYFHNNIPTQINIQSWSHPQTISHNNSVVRIPYNVNPCGAAFPVLNWCDMMRMKYSLLMHRWNLARVLSNEPCCSFINTDMVMDWQYGIGRPNATLLEKNKYCVNSLQHMATKCELDKRGILCSPRLFMDILIWSTLAQGHVVAYYLTKTPRSLTCVAGLHQSVNL